MGVVWSSITESFDDLFKFAFILTNIGYLFWKSSMLKFRICLCKRTCIHNLSNFTNTICFKNVAHIDNDTCPRGARRCCDVKSTSVTLIQRRNNVMCPVGGVLMKKWNKCLWCFECCGESYTPVTTGFSRVHDVFPLLLKTKSFPILIFCF